MPINSSSLLNNRRLFQITLNLILVAVWYLSNEGLLFWDDFSYLNLAHQINDGSFQISTNHFTSRVVLIYPVSWFLDWFGINQYTIVLYPLICSIVLLNLVFWLGGKINQWAGLIGGLLIVCDYHLIYFSNHLFPELPLALCVFVFLLSYSLLLKNEIIPRFAGLVAALALFGAFLIKTTVILLIPLIIYLFINDRKQRRNGSFWLVFGFLSIFFFVLNGFWYLEVKGHFLYRFQNIANNHVATPKTFFDKGGIELLKRLTYLPILGFLKGGFFIPLLLALPAIVKLRRKDFRITESNKFWPVASVFLLLAYWFLSTNWRFYSPIPTENRHIVFFIPVLIMTAAIHWSGWSMFEWTRKNYLAMVFVLGLLLIPGYSIYRSDRTNFKEMTEVIKSAFVENQAAQLVITDGLTSYGYQYFYGMSGAEDVYLWFSETETVEILQSFDDSAYLLVNRAYFNADYDDEGNFGRFIEMLQENEINIGLMQEEGSVELYLLTK